MHFLFQEGVWEGSGGATITGRTKPLSFTTRWTVQGIENGRFRAIQTVMMEEIGTQTNVFMVTKRSTEEFDLFLENENIGVFSGKGIADDRQIAWEFDHYGALEGLEVYNKNTENQYNFKAEYIGADDHSTTINGTITKISS